MIQILFSIHPEIITFRMGRSAISFWLSAKPFIIVELG